VDVDGVVDFSGSYDPGTWPDDWSEAGCDWKYIARIERHDPPTWRIGDALIRDGTKGVLFPSYRHPRGTNLVLFNAKLGLPDRIVPNDPTGKLPRDQRSWR
jgi:RES domain-containing protein